MTLARRNFDLLYCGCIAELVLSVVTWDCFETGGAKYCGQTLITKKVLEILMFDFFFHHETLG